MFHPGCHGDDKGHQQVYHCWPIISTTNCLLQMCLAFSVFYVVFMQNYLAGLTLDWFIGYSCSFL